MLKFKSATFTLFAMRKVTWLGVLLLSVVSSVAQAQALPRFEHFPLQEQEKIADLIYNNECSRQYTCLVAWNSGENFASMGIGHFIWFPQGSKAPFQESFPDLLRWLVSKGVVLPLGLTVNSPCPWNDQAEFLKAEHQTDIATLRHFLARHNAEQAAFIMARLAQALPKMLAALPQADVVKKDKISMQFHRLAASAVGWYVLADYVNFKGEGIKESERYQGQGWGLMQVLLAMRKPDIGEQAMSAVEDFSRAAKFTLQRRITLSPVQRQEHRWLKGWMNRLDTYVQYAVEKE